MSDPVEMIPFEHLGVVEQVIDHGHVARDLNESEERAYAGRGFVLALSRTQVQQLTKHLTEALVHWPDTQQIGLYQTISYEKGQCTVWLSPLRVAAKEKEGDEAEGEDVG
jgi:hypothetical protein